MQRFIAPVSVIVSAILKAVLSFLTLFYSFLMDYHLALQLAMALFVGDFVTGVAVSVKEKGKLKIISGKLGWFYIKITIYVIAAAVVYVAMTIMKTPVEDIHTATKMVIWGIWYTESLSITENLRKLWPEDKIIMFLHYLLSIEVLSFFPLIGNFFKSIQSKSKDEEL